MQETQRSSSAREMMFALEKAKRERLEATMHHFEQHMHQRELTLAEKVCPHAGLGPSRVSREEGIVVCSPFECRTPDGP